MLEDDDELTAALPQRSASAGERSEGISRPGSTRHGYTKELESALRYRIVRRLDFVEQPCFQYFMGLVIVVNVLVIWLETDYEEFVGWIVLDDLFLLTFTVELILRWLHKGLRVFFFGQENMWNMVDFVLVVLGLVDTCYAILILHSFSEATGSSVLRFLRLLRVLRLARVFKMVRRLALFASALIKMLPAMGWFLAMLFIFTFICSIVLTHLLGRAEAVPADMVDQHYKDHIEKNFASVGTSFFTLFQIITTDNWIQIVEPILALGWYWEVFFVFFIAFTSWTMISILTAVACNHMIQAMTDEIEKKRREEERQSQEFGDMLRKAFKDADEDGNDTLDKQEIEILLQSDKLLDVFRQCNIEVDQVELKRFLDMMDVDQTQQVSITDFVEGLAQYQEELSRKHIVKLEMTIKRIEQKINESLDRLEIRVGKMRNRSRALLSGLRKQEQIYMQQHTALWAWQQWALQKDPQAFPQEYLVHAREKPPWLRGTDELFRGDHNWLAKAPANAI